MYKMFDGKVSSDIRNNCHNKVHKVSCLFVLFIWGFFFLVFCYIPVHYYICLEKIRGIFKSMALPGGMF